METYHEWMQCAVPATMAGAPALALPAGFDIKGRAMGVQLVGRVQDDVMALYPRLVPTVSEWVAKVEAARPAPRPGGA